MHTHQGKGDRSRRSKIFNDMECFFKKRHAHGQVSGIIQQRHCFAKAPNSPAVGILGSDRLHPLPRIGHEVTKALIFFFKGIL